MDVHVQVADKFAEILIVNKLSTAVAHELIKLKHVAPVFYELRLQLVKVEQT